MATKQTVPLVIFKDRRPYSCFVDQIYDPDIDGPWEDSDTYPRVIPMEGAIAIDRHNTLGRGEGIPYYVVHVDEVTYKSTLSLLNWVVTTGDDGVTRVLSYGNDKFMLYFLKETKPTKLLVDEKLTLFSSAVVEYQLVRTLPTGKQEIISIYLDSDDKYRGERIPMTWTPEYPTIKKCTNCHTLAEIADGEVVELRGYDNVGVLVIIVELMAKSGDLLNNLAAENDIIINLDAVCLQMTGSDFYIYQRQDWHHLDITPRLEHADGTYEDLTIDDKTCFIYGLENFTPTFPGQVQDIYIKKFLGSKQFSPKAVLQRNQRYLTCVKRLIVLASATLDGIKVSVMPVWIAQLEKYAMRHIGYSDRRDRVFNLDPYVTLRTTFFGNKYNEVQEYFFEIDLSEVFGTAATVPFRQNNWIVLKPYNQFQRYTVADTANLSKIYGVESSERRRPTIHYDKELEQYFIPTDRFRNVEAFLDAFYFAASPPFNAISELKAPTPTHFTIRALDDLTTLITTPIPVESYNQLWNINRRGLPGLLVGSNVIVEFLIDAGDSYQILYGVPVDVFNSSTGYNTSTNDIPLIRS